MFDWNYVLRNYKNKMKKKFPMIAVYFVVGAVFAGLISYSAVREAYRNRKIEDDVENLRKQAKAIQNENDTLSKTIAYLGSQDNIEKTAKKNLNLQKSDENVVVIKPGIVQAQLAEAQKEVENGAVVEVPTYKKWLNLFFKYN
jgi:cell division protein FtsL